MRIPIALVALCAFPAIAAAGVGRGEAERKDQACEQAKAKAKAQATCTGGQTALLAPCECVERNTTIYLKNWRCAVKATCPAEEADTPTELNVPPVP